MQKWITTFASQFDRRHALLRTSLLQDAALVPVCDAVVARKGKYEFAREHASDYGRRTREDRVAWNDRRTAWRLPVAATSLPYREATTTRKHYAYANIDFGTDFTLTTREPAQRETIPLVHESRRQELPAADRAPRGPSP